MIGDIIAKLRRDNKISRYQLAKELNVSDQAIKYWEEGINEPKASYVKRIAIFFDVSADYLLEIDDYAGTKKYAINNSTITHNGNGNISFN